MVEIGARPLGQVHRFPPLPPMTSARELLLDALPGLDPPNRITVTQAAERFMRVQVQGVWQNFDREVTPYLVEPSDATQSRLYRSVALQGPSQSGKTKMLETVAFHAVTCDQKPTLIVHMTQQDRNAWVEEKLDPTIANSPEIADRLGRGRDDSTFSRKRFKSMRLRIGYPTATILSGGTFGLVLLTDFDHMPVTLGGADNPEGTPYRMALQRIKSFMSRGCVLVESSPAWPVIEGAEALDTPHAMPPVEAGIAALYNQGTRGRLYWECRDCGGEFEPRFDRLVYDKTLDPGAAGASAEMGCPHCGALIAPRHKTEFNRAILDGRGGWRHEGKDGALCAFGDEGVRETSIASYALNGAAAVFASWRDLVANYEDARRKAEALGDETDLATVHYTEIGVPHRSIREKKSSVSDAFLRENMVDVPRGTAPDWVGFVIISVDVQGAYFPVQITGFGPDGAAIVIDRFDITQPPTTAPNTERDGAGNLRRLDPSRFSEDWDVLAPLAERVVPVAGADYGLKPVFVTVDFHGEPGVSDNAEAFLMRQRQAQKAAKWRLTRGQGGFKPSVKRIRYEAPEAASGGGKARAIKLLTIGTDRMKDTIDAALRKSEGGAGAMYLPAWMAEDEALRAEYIAELRTPVGWKKKAGQRRNEGLDLTVQAYAAAELKGLRRVNPQSPPAWARADRQNENAAALELAEASAPRARSPASSNARPKARRVKFLR